MIVGAETIGKHCLKPEYVTNLKSQSVKIIDFFFLIIFFNIIMEVQNAHLSAMECLIYGYDKQKYAQNATLFYCVSYVFSSFHMKTSNTFSILPFLKQQQQQQ